MFIDLLRTAIFIPRDSLPEIDMECIALELHMETLLKKKSHTFHDIDHSKFLSKNFDELINVKTRCLHARNKHIFIQLEVNNIEKIEKKFCFIYEFIFSKCFCLRKSKSR